jgi:hypothetical protein
VPKKCTVPFPDKVINNSDDFSTKNRHLINIPDFDRLQLACHLPEKQLCQVAALQLLPKAGQQL